MCNWLLPVAVILCVALLVLTLLSCAGQLRLDVELEGSNNTDWKSKFYCAMFWNVLIGGGAVAVQILDMVAEAHCECEERAN